MIVVKVLLNKNNNYKKSFNQFKGTYRKITVLLNLYFGYSLYS